MMGVGVTPSGGGGGDGKQQPSSAEELMAQPENFYKSYCKNPNKTNCNGYYILDTEKKAKCNVCNDKIVDCEQCDFGFYMCN